jgi:hypothetical protein
MNNNKVLVIFEVKPKQYGNRKRNFLQGIS